MIKVLHYSTHDEDCGIADYQQQYVDGAVQSKRVEHEYFPVSPNKAKLLSDDAFNKLLEDLKHKLESFDILHIQHEFSFFNGDQLEKIITASHQVHKKVIVTVHTAPNAQLRAVTPGGLHPRTILHNTRTKTLVMKLGLTTLHLQTHQQTAGNSPCTLLRPVQLIAAVILVRHGHQVIDRL